MQERSFKSGSCVQKNCAILGVHPIQFSPTSVQNGPFSRRILVADLSQLRTFFGFCALFFIVKACVFIGALSENGRVETKCLPFGNGLLAVCRQHVSAQQQSQKKMAKNTAYAVQCISDALHRILPQKGNPVSCISDETGLY